MLLTLICGYSSQGIAANFTQQDSFVKTILCCRSLFCGSSAGLRVLWHFNLLQDSFSALHAKPASSGTARGERYCSASSPGRLRRPIPEQCTPWDALRRSVQNQRQLGKYFKRTVRHFAWAYLPVFKYKIYIQCIQCLVFCVREILRKMYFQQEI